MSVEGLPRGRALLTHPFLNRGTAFSAVERAALELEGLLPSKVSTIEEQVEQAYDAIARKTDDLEKYIGLIAIQDRNEHLFFRLLIEHIEEFLPIVYTPTVGEACQQFSRIYRRPRGLWITPEHRGRIASVLETARVKGVRLIVATDNERILGLGDLGAGGMGIPVGKLTLYTAAAGIHPAHTLPISLDVGTDNQALLDDPLYIGWRHERLRGEDYFDLIEEFVEGVRTVLPGALLQWEDFKKQTAFTVLDRYVDRLPSFNDDIQGTAAVAAAAVLSASRLTGVPIRDQRILMIGAGAAGIGIARQLRDLLEASGLREEKIVRALAVSDSGGIIHDGRALNERTKEEVAWPEAFAREMGVADDGESSIADLVTALEPTVLIGTSGQPGVFTDDVVRAMLPHAPRPVILPLSNPTAKSEASPEDLVRWSEGRAIIATGSPFPSPHWDGRRIHVGQANNFYVFPGVGLGALASGASRVSSGAFRAAANALAAEVSSDDLAEGMLFPPLSSIRRVTQRIGEAVMTQAIEEGVATAPTDRTVRETIEAAMWWPAYDRLLD